jgi:hypothetical protein
MVDLNFLNRRQNPFTSMSGIAVDVDNRPGLNPALFAENRARLLKRLAADGTTGAILIFGLPEPGRPLCDFEPAFRQESCFFWLTGVDEPDCAVYIDIASGATTLFYPNLPVELEIWMGPFRRLPTSRRNTASLRPCTSRLFPAF